MWAATACVLGLAMTAACAKPRSAAVAVAPPLAVPLPPARVVVPPEEPLPAAASVPEAPVPVPAVVPATPRPPAPRRAGGPPPEVERADVPAPATGAGEGSRELRAAPSAADAQAERAVRDLLARSTRDLNRVNVARLSADGRAQYDQARRFVQQAEQALAARNLVFASTLADKASSLAAELTGR